MISHQLQQSGSYGGFRCRRGLNGEYVFSPTRWFIDGCEVLKVVEPRIRDFILLSFTLAKAPPYRNVTSIHFDDAKGGARAFKTPSQCIPLLATREGCVENRAAPAAHFSKGKVHELAIGLLCWGKGIKPLASGCAGALEQGETGALLDRKSTRLNSSHG